MNDLLTPAYRTVKQFMGGDSVPKIIPRYQRAYSWEPEYVEHLLTDIKDAMPRGKPYFVGAVLCIARGEDDDSHHEIVDGQQRLITLSLTFAAAIHLLQKGDAADIQKHIGKPPQTFIDDLSLFLYCGDGLFRHGSLNEREYRMSPGDSDWMAYRLIIKQGVKNAKHKRLADAYNTSMDFLVKLVEEAGYNYLLEFFGFLVNNVALVEILIKDEANAYKIFEVLNDRNMRLTPVDLIKNKLLSCFGDKKDKGLLDEAYVNWTDTFTACKEKPAQMQDYVRCCLQIRDGKHIPPKDLYEALCDMLEGGAKQNARKLLQDMHVHCHKFSALLNKDEKFWNNFDSKIRPAVGYLKGYRVVYTIMFSMLYARKPAEFVFGAFKILEIFMKRSRAVRDRLTVMEKYEAEFAELAEKIASKKGPKDVGAFFAEIKRIDAKNLQVIPDKSFVEQLSARPSIKEANAKAMLVELSDYWERKHKTATQVDTETVTLEHVLPKNPKMEEWQTFTNEDVASLYIGRLGNLTLLEGAENTAASNRKFADKKKRAYDSKKCGIRLTNELCQFSDWKPEHVVDRQRRLAELAAEVWKFPKS